jgi:hypothetical protein
MADSRDKPDAGTLWLFALAILAALLIWAIKPAPQHKRKGH